MIDLPEGKRFPHQISRNEWIAFEWLLIRELGTGDYYVCVGHRNISEAADAAKNFDLMKQAMESLHVEKD